MPWSGPRIPPTAIVADLLGQGLRSQAEGVALASTKMQWTWRQLDDVSTHLARQYLQLGLQPGDRIASLMPNRTSLVIHYLACLKSGLVATPLNYRYMPPEIDHALELSGAAVLLHHAERDADVAACRMTQQLSHGTIRYRAADSLGLQWEALMGRPAADQSLKPPQPDDVAFIYFTSGSTGKPKGVVHTQRTYAAMLAATIAGMELTADDTFLPASSFSHIGASLFGLATLAAGGRLLVPRTTEAPEVVPLLETFRPTVMLMLPAPLIALVRDHDVRGDDFASIRLCVSGGDRVSAVLEQEFIQLAGMPIDESYGMTEIGLAAICPPSGEIRLGSLGKLCPGYEMSLRDADGAEVDAGAEGRLWIRSATNMIGYWRNDEATAETIQHGWIDTGDMVRIDDEGYLWFYGRQKQIIIHDGSNICPQEVEEAVAAHPSIDQVGVIGVHDVIHGENVRAFVTLKENAERPTSAELIQFARDQVGYKAPEEIVYLPAMPLTASGKVDRTALKNWTREKSEQ
ncbi:class I adenylate-forming enzyme family protein [Blastopirellula retiformator]|uniref:Long-chain-fatty-acid--CoA ligase n=1 Tax=Blastopirellula retiformator TaxID=2527970 RepID=A0A5C5V9G9_9BACT|nr:class I adenylate-forming enzyme family protein [Blastopirellula retiformator]TWT34355.1 Long-chain-fatty-acid--CoA ligase [Blastopirellula retiformator]